MRSSALASYLNVISALAMRYSLRIERTESMSSSDWLHCDKNQWILVTMKILSPDYIFPSITRPYTCVVSYIQSTPDNSNLQGKLKNVRFIGSSKKIAESKVKNSFYFTLNILITFNCRNVKWKLEDTFRLYIRT